MRDVINLWSVTTLQKEALGLRGGLEYHIKDTVAGLCFDRHKIFAAYVEDGDRNGALDWAHSEYWNNLGGKAARGTYVHKCAEALALGQTIDVEPEYKGYVDQYRQFLEDFQPEFLLAEAPVYNLTRGYAGTLDGVAIIDGQTVVIDIKTTEHGPDAVTRKGRPKSRPPFPEVALQLTMYRNAELVGLLADRVETQRGRYYQFNPETDTEPMIPTDGGLCIVVSPEDCRPHPVDTGDEVWRYCRHMIEMARWSAEKSKVVIGPPVQPTRRAAA